MIHWSHSADNTELHIRFDYDPDLVVGVKSIPGRKPVKDDEGKFSYWSVPIKPGLLSYLEGFAAIASEHVPSGVMEMYQQADALAMANHALSRAEAPTRHIELPAVLATALRPFQKAGVQYGIDNRRIMIGDDMGLGKTIQAIAIVEGRGDLPCLVICPASLKYNWRREIEKWSPTRTGHVEILNGKPPADKSGAAWVIVNYDVLKNHQWLWAIPWKALIVDESHYIKNYKAKRTGFVLDLAKNVETVLLLSGTPILNKPVELTAQLSALGRLDKDFGGFWRFVHRYCKAYKGDYGWIMDGADNLDELNDRLRSTCYIRRDKKSVLPELPDKVRTVLPVEIDNRKEYEQARDDLLEFIRERGRIDKKFADDLEKMIADDLDAGRITTVEEADGIREATIAQYRNDKAERAARAEVIVGIETCKQVAARGKMSAIADWVFDFFEQNPSEKLIIFATHKDVIEAIDKTLKAKYIVPLILTGETPAAERDRLVQLFQTDPDCRVFLANIQAGGVGITLTAASFVLFVEFGWNAATMDQAEDRAYRIGQKNMVSVYWMTGRDTIDTGLVGIIEKKRAVVSAAVDGDGAEVSVSELIGYLEKEAE